MEAVRFGGVYVKKESPSLEEMHPGSVGGKIPAKVHIKHEKPVEIDLPSPLGGVDDELLDEIDSEQKDVGGQEEIPLFSGKSRSGRQQTGSRFNREEEDVSREDEKMEGEEEKRCNWFAEGEEETTQNRGRTHEGVSSKKEEKKDEHRIEFPNRNSVLGDLTSSSDSGYERRVVVAKRTILSSDRKRARKKTLNNYTSIRHRQKLKQTSRNIMAEKTEIREKNRTLRSEVVVLSAELKNLKALLRHELTGNLDELRKNIPTKVVAPSV